VPLDFLGNFKCIKKINKRQNKEYVKNNTIHSPFWQTAYWVDKFLSIGAEEGKMKQGILFVGIAFLIVCASIGVASAKIWYVDDDGGYDFTRILMQ